MTIKDFVPEGFKEYLRVLSAKKRFPGRIIRSGIIGPGVELGHGCFLDHNVVIGARAKLGDHTRILRDGVVGADVVVGDYSYLNTGAMVLSGSVGRFCSLSYGCKIGMEEHPVDWVSTSPWTYDEANILGIPSVWNAVANPAQLGSDVWIGAHAVVLQGVEVGHGAIIAAGAIVTKDVAPYSIVAGVPAKVIKSRFAPEEVRCLLESQWWDWPVERLSHLKDAFAAGQEWSQHSTLFT